MDAGRKALALGQVAGKLVKPIRLATLPHEVLKQKFVGRVSSTKMDKSITVMVDHFRFHSKVQKLVRKTTKIKAHDEAEEAREGDLVEIVHCRKRSRWKKHQLSRIIRRFPQVGMMGSPEQVEARSTELEERAAKAAEDPLLSNARQVYPFTKPGLAYLKKISPRNANLMQKSKSPTQ